MFDKNPDIEPAFSERAERTARALNRPCPKHRSVWKIRDSVVGHSPVCADVYFSTS